MNKVANILCIGGHDPTGGAGIQADIETVAALGGRALTLVTALTAQDSHDIAAVEGVSPTFFESQLNRLIRDIRPDAIKLGMIGSLDLIPILRRLLADFGGPVVLDPVLAAGGGYDLDASGLGEAIASELIPRSTLATPNRAEARRLARCENPEVAARALLEAGADAVLLTGADEAEDAESVTNRLFTSDAPARSFHWPRLPGSYHGSGCTLASACAIHLAIGNDLLTAVEEAQAFTWQALRQANRPGGGQWLPGRGA
jgi:hydroxymethylpyrimidine/phosphomethylpyrimidine kinase